MKNGYGDMVLMGMETFENMFQRQKLYRELDISERQIKDGKTRGATGRCKREIWPISWKFQHT